MTGIWNKDGRKIDIARRILIKMVDSLKTVENVQLGLRVYGHQSYVPPQDCSDTRLEVSFKKNNSEEIIDFLSKISPKGTTPIAKSIEYAANDFPDENSRNIIILITDGVEACDGDPCAVSIALQKKGIILKPFVIGIGLDMMFKKTFECVGNYYNAADPKQLGDILNVVISEALNNTTCQINLLDTDGNPTETNVNMTFYDSFSNKIKYNFIHSINQRGNPDTLKLDAFSTYKIHIHTIPPVFIDSAKLTPGKHSIFAVDAPQGYLNILSSNGSLLDVNSIIRKKNKHETLNVQNVNTTEKYITGSYDLEILTLPRIYVTDVEIKQNYTTKIQIPNPGLITFVRQSLGFGSIYIINNGKMEWVYNLSPYLTKETLKLQPGNYIVEFRLKSMIDSKSTIQQEFKVISNGSQLVRIN
jgi:Ca-activated chloride channel family protein